MQISMLCRKMHLKVIEKVFFRITPISRLQDCSHKNQYLLGRFAQMEIFYWDDSPGTIRTNGKKLE